MPFNPMENMPEALRRPNIAIDKFSLTSKEPQPNGNMSFGGPVMFASSGHLEKAPTSMNALGKHGKVRMPIKENLISFMFHSKLCIVIEIHCMFCILSLLSLCVDLILFFML